MNSDNLTQILKQGFRVTLGATASLVETLQDPQKRNQSLDSISSELSYLAQEWAVKGEITEQEARSFVNTLLQQVGNQPPSSTGASHSTTTSSTESAPPDVQLEVQELTAQLAAMRTELENLRSSDGNPN